MDPAVGLRVQVAADGTVHYAGNDGATASGYIAGGHAAASFATSYAVGDSSAVFIAGSVQNAALIVDLYQQAKNDTPIYVVNPLAVPQRASPEEQLNALSVPSPRRRWFKLTERDVVTYELATQCCRGGVSPRQVVRHPAAPAATFLSGIERDTLVKLLVRIGDPRWYLMRERPGRWSGLYTHLGLMPRRVKRMLVTGDEDTCLRLPLAWYRQGMRYGSLKAPGNFLWRCYSAHVVHHGQIAAIMRTTSRFLRYLALYWLAAVTENTAWAFKPEEFFLDAAEVAAFVAHEKACVCVK